MQPRFLIIPAVILAVGGAGAVVWMFREKKDDEATGGKGSKAPQMIAQPSNSANVQAGNNPAAEKPVTVIAALRKAFSGAELGNKLYSAGSEAAKKGIEYSKEFVLAVPPGSIGDQALAGVMHGIDKKQAEEMFQFLRQNVSVLGKTQSGVAIDHLIDAWVAKDIIGARKYLLGMDAPVEDRARWVENLYNNSPRTAETLTEIRAIQDTALRNALVASDAYIAASLEAGSYTVFDELVEAEMNDSLRSNLLRQLDQAKDSAAAITALRKSKLPNAQTVAALAVGQWLARDTNSALTYLGAQEDQSLIDAVISKKWKSIADYDSTAALAWIGRLSNPSSRQALTEQIESLIRQK